MTNPLPLVRSYVESTVLMRVFFAACLGTILYLTFRLFSFSYFWLDDFNNLYWVQKLSGTTLLWDIVNPVSDRFRPVGWFAYWVVWRGFDLAPLPYHVVAWAVHSLNVFLVYILLQRMLQSDYAAAFGALLFTFQSVYWEIYWSFGTIFELLAALLFFLGMWFAKTGLPRSILSILVVTFIYILAMKAKEMAITLPAIWFVYVLLIKRERNAKRLIIRFSIPILVGIWFVYLKTSTMAGMISSIPHNPDHPYYISLNPSDLVLGFGWYLNSLTGLHLHWAAWAATSAVCAGAFLALRQYLAMFFLSYVFICLLPVIVFPNHRFAFFWYIPFFGVIGLAAWGLKLLIGYLPKIPSMHAKITGAMLFLIACNAQFQWQTGQSEKHIKWAREVSQEYRSFMEGVRSLPQPRPKETVYYNAAPRFFDETTILTATQVALRRTDVQAQVHRVFPAEAAYRVRYERGEVRMERMESPETEPDFR